MSYSCVQSFCLSLIVCCFGHVCKDRVYPELQRLMSQQDSRVVLGRDAQWEQILARAACVRDICRERWGLPYLQKQWALPTFTGSFIQWTLHAQCRQCELPTPGFFIVPSNE